MCVIRGRGSFTVTRPKVKGSLICQGTAGHRREPRDRVAKFRGVLSEIAESGPRVTSRVSFSSFYTCHPPIYQSYLYLHLYYALVSAMRPTALLPLLPFLAGTLATPLHLPSDATDLATQAIHSVQDWFSGAVQEAAGRYEQWEKGSAGVQAENIMQGGIECMLISLNSVSELTCRSHPDSPRVPFTSSPRCISQDMRFVRQAILGLPRYLRNEALVLLVRGI
jgi:hypothetical protein